MKERIFEIVQLTRISSPKVLKAHGADFSSVPEKYTVPLLVRIAEQLDNGQGKTFLQDPIYPATINFESVSREQPHEDIKQALVKVAENL